MSAAPLTNADLILLAEKRRRRKVVTKAIPSPLAWATLNATIVHPARGRIPFMPYPYQARFLEMHDAPRRLILKARQIGFSQVFALEALYRAITRRDTTILMVSRTGKLAVELLEYCYKSYYSLNETATMPLTAENQSEMGFGNGSRIISIPANRSTGRGFAASHVYLDEFAYADYADNIYQSVSPTVSQGGSLTIASTPNGVNNKFHELYTSGDFARMTEPWWHCPAYWTPEEQAAGIPKEQAAWYLRERPNYTLQQWSAEFDCSFEGSGAAVFTQASIDNAEVGAIGEQDPQRGHQYLTSVDLGRRQDATVINTFDTSVSPIQRIAHERIERVPWPVIQAMVEARQRMYGGRLVIESNGVGDPVIENLSVYAEPFVTTAKTKTQAIQALVLMLEQGTLKARWTAQERKELTLYTWQDQALTQDCVMSLAIGASEMMAVVIPITPRRPSTIQRGY